MSSLPRIDPNPLTTRARADIERDVQLARQQLEAAKRDRDAVNYDDMTPDERRDFRAHCRHVAWITAHLEELKVELRGAER